MTGLDAVVDGAVVVGALVVEADVEGALVSVVCTGRVSVGAAEVDSGGEMVTGISEWVVCVASVAFVSGGSVSPLSSIYRTETVHAIMTVASANAKKTAQKRCISTSRLYGGIFRLKFFDMYPDPFRTPPRKENAQAQKKRFIRRAAGAADAPIPYHNSI